MTVYFVLQKTVMVSLKASIWDLIRCVLNWHSLRLVPMNTAAIVTVCLLFVGLLLISLFSLLSNSCHDMITTLELLF